MAAFAGAAGRMGASAGAGGLFNGVGAVVGGELKATSVMHGVGRTIEVLLGVTAFGAWTVAFPAIAPVALLVAGFVFFLLNDFFVYVLALCEPFNTADKAVDYGLSTVSWTKGMDYVNPLAEFLMAVLFLALFAIVSLIATFVRYTWVLLTVLAFLGLFLCIEAMPATIITFFQQHLNVASTAVNTAGTATNQLFAIGETILPAYNAQSAANVQTFRTYLGAIQGMQNPLGSRRLQGTNIDSIVTSFAGLTVAFTALENIIVGFLLEVMLPILPEIADVFTFFAQRTTCVIIGMHNWCPLREITQSLFVTPFNIIVAPLPLIGPLFYSLPNGEFPFDIRCDAKELSSSGVDCTEPGAFPSQCTGDPLQVDVPGIYTQGCPPVVRRVLCETGLAESCESVDGVKVTCAATPAAGCPHTERAFTAVGVLQNVEDLGAPHSPCLEVCVNHTALYDACVDGWRFRGACSPELEPAHRRRVQEVFPGAHKLELRDLAKQEDEAPYRARFRSRAEMLADMRAAVPAPKFSVGDQHCDLSHGGGDIFDTIADMTCVNTATFTRNYKARRALPRMSTRGRGLQEALRGSLDFLALADNRLKQFQAREGDPNRLRRSLEGSRATDAFPTLAKLERAYRLYAALQDVPLYYERAARRRAERSLANTVTTTCPDPSLVYCCSGPCVEPGTPCPPTDPNSWVETWCQSLQNAQSAMNGFTLQSWFDQQMACWDQYEENDATFPFSPYASAPVYCWPMFEQFGTTIPALNLNLQSWLTQQCTDATTLTCTCPWYWNNEFDYGDFWFLSVTVSQESRVTNFLITSQFLVSLVTGQQGVLYEVGYAWFAVFSLVPLPSWFQQLFMLRPGFTTYGQETLCAVLHGGSFFTGVLLLIMGAIVVIALFPIVTLIANRTSVLFARRREQKRLD